jgi:hypothetical protein
VEKCSQGCSIGSQNGLGHCIFEARRELRDRFQALVLDDGQVLIAATIGLLKER